MKFNIKNWFHEKKLTTYFTFLSISTIIPIIILIWHFFNHFMDIVIKDNAQNVESFNQSMSDIILQGYSEGKKKNDISNMQSIVSMLQRTKVLQYVYIIDKGTNKITWAHDGNTNIGTGSALEQKILEMQLEQKSQEVTKECGKNEYIRMAFISGNKKSQEMNIVIWQVYLAFVLFVLLGGVSGILLGRYLKDPLDNLTQGIKRFGEGDFEYRLKRTPFKELNEIVTSYNKMAEELVGLYNSLEAKVIERTEALELVNQELKETQSMMVHSEKMRSLGELVAGIAHEINNPINFIYGNMVHFENYTKDIFELIEKYEKAEANLSEEQVREIKEYKDEIDIEFLKGDLVDLINSCREGADRTKNIILDLKNFSRLDETTLTQFDIPKEIDTTLNILHNKFKNRIEIIKNYSEDLPKIEAYGRQLNQVFMNILDNAIYAIKETGTITINGTLLPNKEYVAIDIIDTGIGIEEEDLKKVFEPFFTTKPVGVGTGLGMSIAYKVITAHGGNADITSEVGKGTKFTIVLPIAQHKELFDEI